MADGADEGLLERFTASFASGARHSGIGTKLVALAVVEARRAGCEWMHADFEDRLRAFCFDACGFTPTNGGLIEL